MCPTNIRAKEGIVKCKRTIQNTLKQQVFSQNKMLSTYLGDVEVDGIDNIHNEGNENLDNSEDIFSDVSEPPMYDGQKVEIQSSSAYLKVLQDEKMFIKSMKIKATDNSKLLNLLCETEEYLSSRCDFWSKV